MIEYDLKFDSQSWSHCATGKESAKGMFNPIGSCFSLVVLPFEHVGMVCHGRPMGQKTTRECVCYAGHDGSHDQSTHPTLALSELSSVSYWI